MFLHVLRNTSTNECLKTVHCSIHKRWLKLYHAQKNAVCEHHPEAPPSFFGQSSSKMNCGKVENFSVVRQINNLKLFWKLQYKLIVLCTKEEMEHLACHLCTVQKPLCWSGSELVPLTSLPIWKGNINAGSIHRSHVFSPRLFIREILAHFSYLTPNSRCIHCKGMAM